MSVDAATGGGRASRRGFLAGALLLGLGLRAAGVEADHPGEGPVLALPPEYIKRLLDRGEQPVFFDLRSPEEYREGHLPRARSLPVAEIARRAGDVPAKGRVVLYCDCAPAELQAAAKQLIQRRDLHNVSVLQGGFVGWVKRGYPVER